MTSLRWILLAAGMAAAWVVASCGPAAPPCTPSTCRGCCDGTGHCQPGTTNLACGFNAGVCATCGANQICQFGLCTFTGAGGGTGPTGDAGPGGPVSSSDGGSANGGGDGGTTKCDASSCTGCCKTDGTCQVLTHPSACGASGQACIACAPNEQCNAGRCEGSVPKCPQDCPTSCCKADGTCGDPCAMGCCAPDGTCLPGTTNVNCGKNRATCQNCLTSGLVCEAQTCQQPQPQPCTGCTASQCCDGTSGTCRTNSNTSCGLNGASCTTCNSPTACGVSSGTCSTSGWGGIGAPCSSDSACAFGTNSQRPWCVTGWPGGYCLDICSSSQPCAAGTLCVNVGATVCLNECTAAGSLTECRADQTYVCYPLSSGQKVCLPKCNSSADCGTNGAACDNGLCCGKPGYPCCNNVSPRCTDTTNQPTVCGTNGLCP